MEWFLLLSAFLLIMLNLGYTSITLGILLDLLKDLFGVIKFTRLKSIQLFLSGRVQVTAWLRPAQHVTQVY
jgi:hypothetical protein